MTKIRFHALLLLILWGAQPMKLLAVDVVTYRYDHFSSGVNDKETNLTLDSVNPLDFGLKFSVPVTGQLYAQPLVKTGVGSSAKELAFVATQANVVMAIDTKKGIPVWTDTLTNFGTPVPNGDVNSGDINPQIGICSTPVIDGNFLYLLSKGKINTTVPQYTYTIYKIDIENGKVLLANNFASTSYDGANYTYRATDPYVIGNGDGGITTNNQTRVYFNALRQMNREALSLVGGVIYAGFASHGDQGPYHGWVLGFDPSNLKTAAVLNLTPNGYEGGIWQAGGRIASDDKNNMYLETGNGSFDVSQTNLSILPPDGNYGDCIVKIARDLSSTPTRPNINGWGLKVVDYFTPTNNSTLNDMDLDLGSGGTVVIPSGTNTFIVGLGKDGSIFSMNSTNMGRFNPNTNNCQQTIYLGLFDQGSPPDPSNSSNPNFSPVGYCTPCYFNHSLYYFGAWDFGKRFSFTNGILGGWYLDGNGQVQTDVESTNSYAYNWPGANSSISATGSKNAILWTVDPSASILHAYRATDLLEIWNSSMVETDNLKNALKFTVPVVANGKTLIGTDGALLIYGTLSSERN